MLQETFAHLLFANYSYKADGSNFLSLLRRDNDNVSVDRDFQSESTVAFVAGFADFLAGAVRNDSRLLDSWVDAGGVSRVAVFDLTDHGFVLAANKGEFTRGSIAVSLWGLWKNTLGGTPAGLAPSGPPCAPPVPWPMAPASTSRRPWGATPATCWACKAG